MSHKSSPFYMKARAGLEKIVEGGSVVFLEGSVEIYDQTGSFCAISYSWAQISGTKVTLLNANKPNTSFIAPQVGKDDSGNILTFRLTVTNNNGVCDSDEVNIMIKTPDKVRG